MRDAFDGIRNRMGVIVHRIDAPLITRHMVRSVADAVQQRIAHLHVRVCHVNLGAQNMLAVFEFPFAHAAE